MWDRLRFWIKAGQLGPFVRPVTFLDQSRSVGTLRETSYIFKSTQVSWGPAWDRLRFWIKAGQMVGTLPGTSYIFGSTHVS